MNESEILNRLDLLGKQITQMKELYEKLLIEIKVIKEGGNI